MTRNSQALSDGATGLLMLFAATVAYRILRIFYWPLGLVGGATLTVGGLYLLARALRPTLRVLFRDPYSLDSLREVEEKERDQPLDIPKEQLRGVYCPKCDAVYPSELGICPRCGRSN